MFIDQPGIRLEMRARSGEWLTADRVLAYGGATLVLSAVLISAWAWMSRGFTADTVVRPAEDFAVFWIASHLTLHGAAASVYDYPFFSHLEHAQLGGYLQRAFLPYLYPPTTLVLMAPLALIPYAASLAIFIGASLTFYARSILALSALAAHLPRRRLGVLVLLAFPGVLVALMTGQNSLLTATLAVLAVRYMDRNPWVSGIFVGLLVVKPQLGLLFPIVLIGIGAWRTIASAAATTLLIAGAAVLECGVKSLPAFLRGLSIARGIVLERVAYWETSPSPLAALRLAGYSAPVAYAVQAGVGLLAAWAAVTVWRATRDVRMRAAVLAVSTLLCAPYLWHYELTWLGIPLFCLVAIGLERGWMPGEQPVVVLAWFLPAYEYFNRLTGFPQIGPLVLLAVLLTIVRRVRATMRGVR